MDAKLDKPLDELIKQSRTDKKTEGGPGKASRQGKGKARASAAPYQPGGGRRSGGGGGGRGGLRQPTPQIAVGGGPSRSVVRPTSLSTSHGARGGAVPGGNRLFISNLDFGVTTQDIHDLFTEIGPLKAAMVHYNEQQKSTGTAFVVFKNPADAAKAVEAYHLVPLDGRPLKVQMVSPAGGASPMTAPARGGRQGGPTNAGPLPRTAVTLQGGRPDGGRGGRGAGRGRGGGGGRGGRGTRKEKSTPVSMEDLDADLDSYRQTKSGEDMAAE